MHVVSRAVVVSILLSAPLAYAQEAQPAPDADAGVAPPATTEPAPLEPTPKPDVAPEPPPKPAAKASPKITGAPGKGVTLFIDDAFSMNIRARFQARYQWAILQENAKGHRDHESALTIQTLRLYFGGHVYKPELQYLIQLALAARDFRDGATSPIFDAYIDWKAHRDFNVKVGQYFVPFDRLRTVREFSLQMADRPFPVNELTLDRDTGVTLYSDQLLGSPLAVRLGVFGGRGTNQLLGADFGGLGVARVEVRPLGPIDDDSEGDLDRKPHPRIAIGGGAAYNWNTNRLRSTTGPTFVGGTTDYRHLAADLVFKWWGFALQGEYLHKLASNPFIDSADASGRPLREFTRSAHGFVVQASYVFDPPIEIVGRFSQLYTVGNSDPKLAAEVAQRGEEVGAGLNYYINGHKLKVQADWIARMPSTFVISDASHIMHLLLDATF
jgi:hypothetical protein